MYSLYSMFDTVTGEGSQPFVGKNNLHAKRIMQEAQRPNPRPEDFRLYKIGELSLDGLIITPTSPVEEIYWRSENG